MFTVGLTSVTFRKMSVSGIIQIAAETGLDGIEWGGDIHVPHGDTATAAEAWRLTLNAGLRVLSYGSYYRACPQSKPESDFLPVLHTALALHAPNIRVWAGEKDCAEADDDYRNETALHLDRISKMAGEYGVSVSTEFHRGSLTACASGARRLLHTAGVVNLYTYWQPNPDISFEDNKKELTGVLPILSNIHVFHWGRKERYPLAQGESQWSEYLSIARSGESEHSLILEFVLGDEPENFREDAAVLLRLAKNTEKNLSEIR